LCLPFNRCTIDKDHRVCPVDFRLVFHRDVLLILFVIASLVHHDFGEDKILGNAEDQEQPEQVDGLKRCKQCKCDVLTDPAFVLLSLPIQLERANRTKFGKRGPEDPEIEIVPEVDPDTNKEGEIRADNDGIEVVECFGGLNR